MYAPSAYVSFCVFMIYNMFFVSGMIFIHGCDDVNERSFGAFWGLSGWVYAPSGYVSFCVFMIYNMFCASGMIFIHGCDDVIKRSFGVFLGPCESQMPHLGSGRHIKNHMFCDILPKYVAQCFGCDDVIISSLALGLYCFITNT